MQPLLIEAEIRTPGGKGDAKRLRRAGKVPAIVYGAGQDFIPVAVSPRQLEPLLRAERRNIILTLQIKDGERTPVMMADPQFEPVRGTLLHVDLKRIAMDRKIRVAVPITLVGEAEGVKVQGGFLETVLREVEVECLPTAMPETLPVTVDALCMGDQVRVADLQKQWGESIRFLHDPHSVICHVVAPKVVEAAPVAAAILEAPAEPEVIRKGKAVEKEEGEAAESSEK